MTSYLVDVYGEAKDFKETMFDENFFSMKSQVVKQWPNSYTLRIDLTADNEDEVITHQLWEGFFKNQRWFRVYKLDKKGEVVAILNLFTDKFINVRNKKGV